MLLREDKKDSEDIVALFKDTVFKDVEKTYVEKMVYSFKKCRADCGQVLVEYGCVPASVVVVQQGSVKVGQANRRCLLELPSTRKIKTVSR